MQGTKERIFHLLLMIYRDTFFNFSSHLKIWVLVSSLLGSSGSLGTVYSKFVSIFSKSHRDSKFLFTISLISKVVFFNWLSFPAGSPSHWCTLLLFFYCPFELGSLFNIFLMKGSLLFVYFSWPIMLERSYVSLS